MKKLLVMTTLCCLVLGFQNCARSGMSGSSSESSSTGAAELNSSSSQMASVTEVEIPYGQGGELVVNVSSGQIQAVNAQDQATATYCVSSSNLQQLQTLLASAQLCEGSSSSGSADQVCAQVYTAPYATLVGSSVMTLGESLDSCGTGLQDLCGSAAASFKTLVSNISSNLQSCQ